MKIFLHIGAGKCASSSVQSYFSYNNVIDDFAYVALMPDGNILDSVLVKKKAELSPNNYAASSNFEEGVDREFIRKFSASIEALSKKYNKILLSSEGWGAQAESFSSLESAFKGHDVQVIYIVRPPVLWMNSAWWQWQQWDGIDVDLWVNTSNVAHQWFDTYNKFHSLNPVSDVHVLSLQKDILQQVADIMSVNIGLIEGVHNSASSSELLNFFRIKRSLRTGPHDSGGEFILNKLLKQRTGVDWVLSEENVKTILKNSEDYCLKMADLISNEDIKNNSLWWDLASYENKIASADRENSIGYDTMASMLEEAYHLIIKLDEENRNG